MGKLIRALLGFLAVPLIFFGVIWGSAQYVAWYTAPYRYTKATKIPSEDVAVVFGAGVIQSTGEVGAVLKGRMDTAIALYQSGKVQRLVLSGDSSQANHDEVTPMVKYAQEQGVASAALQEDRQGISTYQTCYRLNHILQVKKAILVTNEYHMPRAVYTCRALGVESVGMATPNYAGFEYNRNQREPLATLKMFLDLYVASPKISTD